jgi:amidophosphoribosyltransferase
MEATMCGFVGMIAATPVAGSLLLALQTIQHRGQDAAGVGTWDDRRPHLVKGLGMIAQAVPVHTLPTLVGNGGIAHVRYPTAGSASTVEDAQPFRSRQPGVLLAHNGNVTNMAELTAWLRDQGYIVLSQCDAEPILLTFTQALTRDRPAHHTTADVIRAVREVRSRVRGAYSVTALVEVDDVPTLVAFRDPYGIRPGVYGQRAADGAWMTASESVALDVLEFTKEGDLPVDDVVLMRPSQPASLHSVLDPVVPASTAPAGAPRPCIFERVYFARPDSIMEGGRVNRTRWRMGRQLAREWQERGLEADLVVAVPDTSRPAAQAMAEEMGIPNREGFIKNRYSGRTFIMPDQSTRDAALRLKLNPIREMFEGKRVLLVDDSIVRGSTMRRIVAMLRGLKPIALHIAIFSPPVRHPCFYGIDMPSREELVASAHRPEDVQDALAQYLGADSLTFLSIDGMKSVTGPDVCAACFDGDYVVPITDTERAEILRTRRVS